MNLLYLAADSFNMLIQSWRRPCILPPPRYDSTHLLDRQAIPAETMQNMEGIYRLAAGSKKLGTCFVCKVTTSHISFFSDKDGLYIILEYGYRANEEAIRFTGFWRFTKSRKQGPITFSMPAAQLFAGSNTAFELQGSLGKKTLKLVFERPFSEAVKAMNFMVVGHRGVQTDGDPPYAENSINGVLHAEAYGVNAIELDIRLTSDGIPICVHDEKINRRTVAETRLPGKWEEHSFQAITENLRLLDGQQVPSLEQALDAVINATNLNYVWMDIKGGKGIFKQVEPLVRAAYEKASAKNRNVVFITGIPSGEVLKEYQAQPSCHDLPLLIEDDLDWAVENGACFYGPRYTKAFKETDKAHAKGIKVICWTLNKERFIRRFLADGDFDGFVTDNPSLVLYQLYTRY